MSGLTLGEAYRRTKERLKAGGIEAYETETRFFIEGLLGADYQQVVLHPEAELVPEQLQTLEQALERRLGGYPLQYLLGSWEFYGYPFCVGEGVLIPRADTEVLCEAGMECLKSRKAPTAVDLCSGSGCLAVVLALECPNANVYAVEKHEAALEYLRQNVALNGAPVHIVQGDVLTDEFPELPDADLVVCNPPYLTGADMAHLQTEVAFEPPTALYGEEDGLCFYRAVAAQWTGRVKPGGRLIFEIGMGQEQAVSAILAENGWQNICTRFDSCGIIRIIAADRP